MIEILDVGVIVWGVVDVGGEFVEDGRARAYYFVVVRIYGYE